MSSLLLNAPRDASAPRVSVPAFFAPAPSPPSQPPAPSTVAPTMTPAQRANADANRRAALERLAATMAKTKAATAASTATSQAQAQAQDVREEMALQGVADGGDRSPRRGGAAHLRVHLQDDSLRKLCSAGGWTAKTSTAEEYAGLAIETTRDWARLMVRPVTLL